MGNGVVERVVTASPIAAAGARVIASPFQFYLDGADNIRIEGWNSMSNVALNILGRFFKDDGTVQVFQARLPLTSDRVRTVRDFPVVRGYLLNLIITAEGASPKIGQTFARASVIRGLTGATVVVGVMLQGYVTAQQALGWPGSPIQNSLDAAGCERFITGTNPALGAAVNEVVPTGARWQVLTVRCRLQTSATVIDRRPFLRFDVPGPLGTYVHGVTAVAVASSTLFPIWGNGVQASFTMSNVCNSPLPVEQSLFAGMAVYVDAEGLQADDRYDQIYLLVREWLDVG